MFIFTMVLAGLALMVGWTISYHHYTVLKRWKRGVLVGLAVLLVGVTPLGAVLTTNYLGDRAQRAEIAGALDLFGEAYPEGTLGSAAKLQDVWLYSYTNDSEAHSVLYVGGTWLEITAPSGEAPETEVQD